MNYTKEQIIEAARNCLNYDDCPTDCPLSATDCCQGEFCHNVFAVYIISTENETLSQVAEDLAKTISDITTEKEPAPTAIGTSSEQIKPKDSVTLLGENVKSPSKIAVDRAHDMLLAVYEMLLAVYENLPEEKQRAWDLEKIRPYEPNLVKAAWNVFGESYTYRQKYNQYKAKRRDEIKNKANENQLSLMDLEDKK